MSEGAAGPETTHRLFAHDRVAEGYSSARPFLHPAIFARVRERMGASGPLGRALDVGCGTGMSSVALRGLAAEVVGVDPSRDMLRRARRAEGVRYAASLAEAMPFRKGAFDLVVACGSIDWVDRAAFLPCAAEILAPRGWLVPLDFGDLGRSDEVTDLEHWYEDVFQKACPRPPSRDPLVTADEATAAGFGPPDHHTFTDACCFTAAEYAAFLMTESNVIAAIEYGRRTPAEVQRWLEGELRPLFGEGPRAVTFGGYIQVLRKR
jgi:SAM-dependent methyltransferase